jgi:hypothetical protein
MTFHTNSLNQTMKKLLAITSAIICCLGNQQPAKADFNTNFAGGVKYALACKTADGTITAAQAAQALKAALRKNNVPVSYAYSEAAADVARGMYLKLGGCI